jgi:hypothetical protein
MPCGRLHGGSIAHRPPGIIDSRQELCDEGKLMIANHSFFLAPLP